MAKIKYEIGSVVEHPVKPDWGRGRVEAVETPRLLVRWTGAGSQSRWMWTDAVPLPLSGDQSDPFPGRKPSTSAAKKTPRPRAKAPAAKGNFMGGIAPEPSAE
jgi:hypothetical protein